jgi:hypothetical protein
LVGRVLTEPRHEHSLTETAHGEGHHAK